MKRDGKTCCEEIMNVEMKIRITLNKFVIFLYFVYDVFSYF